jgi:hypothetical protein
MGAVGIASLAAALAAVVVALALLLVVARRDARLRAELGLARAESAELRARLAELEAAEARHGAPRGVVPAEFVITDAGTHPDEDDGPRERPDVPAVPDRVVLGATLGEPLVKAFALAHGVRRALSAESRNRIRFAMRQEVRRTRRQRRREMKQAWRRMQAAERASGDAA